MYHAMYPPQMMVQIMGGQQANGHCPPAQTYALQHIGGANAFHQPEYTQYRPDVCTQSRHHMMQTGSYPLELLQLMGVEIPSLRRLEYVQANGGSSTGNWQRRMNTLNSTPMIPPPHLTFRPVNTGPIKKSNWSNKTSKRNSHHDSFINNEKYNSDSGFSSRSPTPNKYHIDSSQTESSDERDSVISSGIEQGIKKLHRAHTNNVTNERVTQPGMISSASAHQFYQNQRPVNYYHTIIPTPRTQGQNYQNKRRFHAGRNKSPPQRLQRRINHNDMETDKSVYFQYNSLILRSRFIEVNYMPDKLLTGSIWDNLSKEIWFKFLANQQTEKVYKSKVFLWRYLYYYIKAVFPIYGLWIVGSTMTGFGSSNSDVDMCVLVKRPTQMNQRNEAIHHLREILQFLKRCEFLDQLELIHAKVPILKFHDTVQNLEIDLNCNSAVGIRNTHLLYCYSRIDWRVRPLVLVIKLWAQSQDINDAKNMTISSYSLVLMVIHFLQCGVDPPILPCLQSLFKDKFGSHVDVRMLDNKEEWDIPTSILCSLNHQSLGELFVEFFRYYVKFDFNKYAISVRLGNKILIDDCRQARGYKNDPFQWKYLCIEEPFDLTNTARSVYDPVAFSRIKQAFNITYQKLKESRDLTKIFVPSSPYVMV